MINITLSTSRSPLVSKATPPSLTKAALGPAALLLMAFGLGASSAFGSIVTFVAPSNVSNGSSSIQSGTLYNTTNLGYAFMTGSSGTFDIDWVGLELTSGATAATASFNISIHGTDNTTAYSAVANSTVYATDTVSVTTPGTANTPFNVNFTSADIPNITSFSLQPNTAYSLFVNGSTPNIALRRTQGLANGTTNDNYTVTNGFTMLDTFRNNTPNYSNSPGSYATFAMSFGGTAAAAAAATPEPAGFLLGGVPALLGVGALLRRRVRPAQAAR